MCNLYSMNRSQDEICGIVGAMRDETGNMPPLPGIFPDYVAPIVRTGADGARELVMARWGMPGPPQFGGAPITNIRNTKSAHWRGWLSTKRCVVPWTSFCEYEDTKPRKTPTWFSLGADRPHSPSSPAYGRPGTARRRTKANPVEGEHQLFGFLTTDPNAEVAPIHPKAMPVILTTAEEIETWLTAPTEQALKLQRPLPDGSLKIIARGEKEDPPPAPAQASLL
jgi:putative SOS response-associated peptidase YedK